jgi:4-amino-4-deoxy-L-arabinose transferase-like glycosyltransferase
MLSFPVSVSLALLLALCLHWFFFARGFYSIGWDESGRTLDAYAWSTGRIVSDVWLPFHRVCVGLALRLHPDLVLTPRVVTLIFGLGSIVATAWLAHELFANRKTTLMTLALAALFPQRVVLSLAPLSDIMFTLVILASAALLVRWLRTGNRSALFACALVGGLATTIRYEGWFFAPAIFVVACSALASHRIKWTDLLLFGTVLFAFPAWWTAAGFLTSNPIAVIVSDVPRLSRWQILRKNPFVEFVVTNVLSLNLVGVLSILHLARRGPWTYRAVIAALFAPLAAVSLVLLAVNGAQSGPSWRMILVWSMLLLPFTACVLANGLHPSVGRATRNARAGATVLVIGAFVYGIFRFEGASTWAFPESDRRAGQYLNDLIRTEPGTKILIDSSNYVSLNVQVASQHPQAFVLNSLPRAGTAPILTPAGPVRDALVGRGIDLLVFRSDDYRHLLDHSPAVTRLEQFGAWSIYRLVDPEPSRSTRS